MCVNIQSPAVWVVKVNQAYCGRVPQDPRPPFHAHTHAPGVPNTLLWPRYCGGASDEVPGRIYPPNILYPVGYIPRISGISCIQPVIFPDIQNILYPAGYLPRNPEHPISGRIAKSTIRCTPGHVSTVAVQV